MKITKEEVEYVAHLARLEFSGTETEKFTSQLNDILLYMEKLNQVNTDGVEPLTHAAALSNVFREDRALPSLPHDLSLANAPDRKANSFRVPKVIE